MTMADGRCEVCFSNVPIGVACTAIPLSIAYCRECATRFAQPLIVFEMWYEDFGTNFDQPVEEVLTLETFSNGRYITYKEWAKERERNGAEET